MLNPKKPQPLVGVCGVQSLMDLLELERRARHILPQTGYILMAGVKSSQAVSDFSGQLNGVRIFVHCDFSAETPFEKTVSSNLKLTAGCVNGLQLNILRWMEMDLTPLLNKIKNRYPHVALILQAHHQIMYQYTPKQIADRIQNLPIDYLLFDPSQSRGLSYDLGRMADCVDAVYDRYAELGIMVAGGLGGQTIETSFLPLLDKYSGLSCDAFGKLQDRSTGQLSWPAVDSYLQAWRRCLLKKSLEGLDLRFAR